jgi:hypothetical protein
MLISWAYTSYKAQHWVDFEFKTFLLNIAMLQDIPHIKPDVISKPYMDNLALWSLSYEFWFYVFFIFISQWRTSSKTKNHSVYTASTIASVVYLFYPYFTIRLLMYMAIFWTGVVLSTEYIQHKKVPLQTMAVPLLSLGFISSVHLYHSIAVFKMGLYKNLGTHPILEFRHFFFSLIAIVAALVWQYFKWNGFYKLFGIFIKIAPISYSIYISHIYFVTNQNYLDTMNNKFLETILYCVPLFLFSYILELVIYPRIKNLLS